MLVLLALVLLAAGALAWRFNDELRAFWISRQYSTGELEEQLGETEQTISSAVDALEDITVRAPTQEEKKALQDGEITQEELIEKLTGGTASPTAAAETPAAQDPAAETPAQTAAPESSAAPDAKESGQQYQKKLSELIAKVYVLREEYTNALAGMEASAKSDYYALPESQRTASKLAPLVSSYLAKATALEKECDGKMDELIAEMEKLISDNGGDMSLTDTVFDTYVKEKSLKKAWYMSRLQEKGLI